MDLKKIYAEIDSLEPELIRTRRDFHKYAESAWTEFRTTSKIVQLLRSFGYDVKAGREIVNPARAWAWPGEAEIARRMERAVAQGADRELVESLGGYTGAAVTIATGKPGPVIALRFDIDCNDVNECDAPDHRPTAEGFLRISLSHENEKHELLLSWSQNTLPLDNTLNTNILKVLTAVNTVSYTIGILFWFSYIYIRLKVGKISEIKAASVIALPAFIWAGVVITSIGTGLVFYFKDGLPYAGPIYKVHTMVDCMYLLSGFFIALKSYFDSRNAEVEWRNASIVIISSVPLLLSEMLWPVFEGTALPLVALFLAYAILYFDRVAEYSSVDMVTGLDSKGMFKRKWRNILSRLPKDAKPYLFAIKIDSTLNEDYYNSEPMELAIKIVASQIKTYLATSEGMACCYKSNIFLLYLIFLILQ